MLKLQNIHKEYPAGDGVVHALKGIDLSFRQSEFVSILGPSGCGKTTLLNIIGGLDGYTQGDLAINGTSTKQYKDRDWDAYRNHSIGFVFQNYNLIPHQTVLQNVELALTLSGVSKSQRRARAKQALEEVGLGNQINKRPNEMSGGQMQRVAIARALVNDPDIILADEPTGALDTETSVQVMEILKRISQNRLIIMVTHNPDLAETYSTRIIKMLDGVITDDSNPLSKDEILAYEQQVSLNPIPAKKEKKPSMSFATSFMLSLKNLFTKKGRTILTSFAGSIGIIGIALILAISQGTTAYIDAVQESTLSAYPITLESTTVELTTLMETFMDIATESPTHEKDGVYKKPAMYNIINAINNIEEIDNDLASFKAFLIKQMQNQDSSLKEAVNGVQYSYQFDLQIYTKNVDGNIIRSDSQKIMQDLIMQYMEIDMASMNTMTRMSPMAQMGTMASGLWQELLPGNNGEPVNDLLHDQYDVVYGAWPNEYNEIVLVLDQNNELDDVTLYALGLLPEEDMKKLANAAVNGSKLEVTEKKWTYEDVCNATYKTVLNADCYAFDETTGLYSDLRDTDAGLRYLYDNALPLKVTGVIRPKETADTTMLTGSICYTAKLTEYLSKQAKDAKVITDQLADPHTDVLTGLPFDDTTGSLSAQQKEAAFRSYLEEVDQDKKADAYLAIQSIPSQEFLTAQTNAIRGNRTREELETSLKQGMLAQMNLDEQELTNYLSNMSDEEFDELFTQMMEEQLKAQYAAQVQAQMAGLSKAQMAAALSYALPDYTTEQCALYYDEVMVFSDSTYEQNLMDMGYIDLDDPATINMYASSFENKDIITDAISDYNDSVDDLQEIQYTDYIGIMMSSITTIINAITYVLIAFVAISLIVSSIMIGVITLISVQERTKEIGILRAIGASKKNVSRMFNAETMIVGFASGLLGVVVTYLLCIPINIILYALTDIANLRAFLPLPAALILIAISVILTLISGIIPSRSAAKKDPVVALRTE